MRKAKHLKSTVFSLGLLIFLNVAALASEPERQATSDSGSNLSSVPDTLTRSAIGTKKKKKHRSRKLNFFSGSLSLGEMYDDNILSYSSTDLQLLDSGLKPTKFAIRAPSDYRTSTDFRVNLNPQLLRHNPTRLTFGLGTNFFARNSLENYQTYEADLKQNFFRRNYFQAGFRYVPNFYLRNLVQVDTATGRREKYLQADFSRYSYIFELGRKFSSHFELSLGYVFEKTDYDPKFNERDSRANIYYGDMDFGIGRYVDLILGYSRKECKAEGANMMLLIEDISSQTDRFDIRLNLNLKHALGIPFSLAPSYAHEYQKYTTFKTLDTYHFGRKDDYYRISSEVSYRWDSNFSQQMRYSYERNKTNKQGTLDVGDYRTTKISTGFTWSF